LSLNFDKIEGQLTAIGLPDARIRFTSSKLENPTRGDWSGIYFRTTAVGATYDQDGYFLSGSILRYCDIEYAGGGTGSTVGALTVDNINRAPYIRY
jgi:hypothetical protein